VGSACGMRGCRCDDNTYMAFSVDWIQMAEYKMQWQDPVDTVMNLQFHNSRRISCRSHCQFLKDSAPWL